MVSHPIHLPVPVFTPPDRPTPQLKVVKGAAPADDEFLKAMLETPFSRHVRMNPLDWLLSFIVHGIVIAALIITPLYFTDVIDLKAFTQTFLVGPPPPAPPPAAVQIQKIVRAPVSSFIQGGRLLTPVAIPKGIAMVKEAPLPPDTSTDGVVGGVPGGIPGGQIGGVLGGILGGTGHSEGMANIPPPSSVRRIVRVGGDIKAPRLVYQPDFFYPPIARAARVQGEVLVEAIIDEHGQVVEVHAVSGPGLLVPAAVKAVSQWRYEPTLLNGEPVSVHMTVHVNYVLN